jgi:F-type H+-transporting ATPase subunit b
MKRFLTLLAAGWLLAAVAPAAAAQETPAPATAAEAAPAAESPMAESPAPEAPTEAGHTPEAGPAHADEATHAGEAGHAAGEAGHAAGDHGHHDPHELSHGNASAQLKAAQELRFDLGIATFIVFLLLLAILAKFAWGPIAAGLDKREETIARQIAEAKQAAATASKQLQEYERKLAAATEEARSIVTQARTDAAAAKESLLAEAQAAATRERERAVADIAAAKNEALREIADLSVNTAVSLAGKIIRREVKPEDHDRLIADSLQQFSQLN